MAALANLRSGADSGCAPLLAESRAREKRCEINALHYAEAVDRSIVEPRCAAPWPDLWRHWKGVRLFWSDAESPELQPIRGQKAPLPRVLHGLEPRASPDL